MITALFTGLGFTVERHGSSYETDAPYELVNTIASELFETHSALQIDPQTMRGRGTGTVFRLTNNADEWVTVYE